MSRDELLKTMNDLWVANKDMEYFVFCAYPDAAILLSNIVKDLEPSPGKYTKIDYTLRKADVYVYWPNKGDDKRGIVVYCPLSALKGKITKE